MARLSDTVKLTMYYGASSIIIDRANQLRRNTTIPEKLLWEKLNNNQLLKLHFRRQHPIYRFIADFYCHKIKLVIELDGDSHTSKEAQSYDENRTAEMENFGIVVVRFKNEEVINQLPEVVAKIVTVCENLLNN